jgi:hypothetical protein
MGICKIFQSQDKSEINAHHKDGADLDNPKEKETQDYICMVWERKENQIFLRD